MNDAITYFAETDYRNQKIKFGIKAIDRTRHMYIIGMTGMGKSILLESLAIQDIVNGEGLVFLDPHGGSGEKLLHFIPEHRMKDVIYVAPFDLDNPISFNVMEDTGPDKRHLVASGLMSTFKKIWTDAWSARMEYILNNTILALLEYPGATLLAVNKMLSDKEYRKKVVDNISDPSVKSFWVDEFAKYTDKFAAEATPAIQNKIGQFTMNPLIRNIIGQPKSSFDLREVMDKKKILIVNLSKGRIGEQNANLLGGMFITKLYLAAMSRAEAAPEELAKLPNCYLYVDEFQSFANDSFANILAEARKYKLNLIMAHQYIEQMSDQVREAVFGNVGTMIVFRVGPTDAEHFEKEFANVFTVNDIVSLGLRQVYLRLMIDGVGSKPFSATTFPYTPIPPSSFYNEVIENSRLQYASKRDEVEAAVIKSLSSDAKKDYIKPQSQNIEGFEKSEIKTIVPPPALKPNPNYIKPSDRKPEKSQESAFVKTEKSENQISKTNQVSIQPKKPYIKQEYKQDKNKETKTDDLSNLKLGDLLNMIDTEEVIKPDLNKEIKFKNNNQKEQIAQKNTLSLKEEVKNPVLKEDFVISAMKPKTKGASIEQKQSLRELLSKVYKPKEEVNIQSPSQTHVVKAFDYQGDKMKEIPEDKLRKILVTDDA